MTNELPIAAQYCVFVGTALFLGACSLVTSFDGLAASSADAAAVTDASNPRDGGGTAMDADAAQNTLVVGLAGYWSFDETAGQVAADFSGNGNDGALMGGVTHVTGKVGGALQFDGTSGYVHIPTNSTLIATSTMSIAFWAQFEGSTLKGQPRVFARDNAWDVKMNGDSPQLSSGGPGYAISSAQIATGAWHHFAFVFDAGTTTIYVDGAPTSLGVDTFASGAAFSAAPGDVLIGAYPGNPPSQYVTALLDEVRLYTRTLTAAEVSALAQ